MQQKHRSHPACAGATQKCPEIWGRTLFVGYGMGSALASWTASAEPNAILDGISECVKSLAPGCLIQGRRRTQVAVFYLISHSWRAGPACNIAQSLYWSAGSFLALGFHLHKQLWEARIPFSHRLFGTRKRCCFPLCLFLRVLDTDNRGRLGTFDSVYGHVTRDQTIMTKHQGVLGWILLLLAKACEADFLTSFNNVTVGSSLLLQWHAVDASNYPLTISVRMFNRTDNNRASSVKANLTSERWPFPRHGG